jgi:hypothetical protein
MASPLLQHPLFPRTPPWWLLGPVGVATGVGMFVARVLVPEAWSMLLDPFACVAHGAAAMLAIGLIVDAVRLRGWSQQLDHLGEDDSRPNWAAAAVAQCLAQFSHIPHPDEVRAKFGTCSSAWAEEMEFRSNIYLMVAVLLGLPLQLAALQRLADPRPIGTLATVTVPLAVAGLEVLGVALPAFLLQRAWRELFKAWYWRVSAVETYRRFDTTGTTAHVSPNAGGSWPERTLTARTAPKWTPPGANRASATLPPADTDRAGATVPPAENRLDPSPDDDEPLYFRTGEMPGTEGADQAVTSYPGPPQPGSFFNDDEEIALGG